MDGIDHVFAVHDGFADVSARYEALGFQLTDVTHHPTGSGNRLAVFSDTYLELMAMTRPELADATYRGLVDGFLGVRSGLEGIGFATTDHEADADRLRAAGAPGVEVFSFERPVRLPDGSPSRAEVDAVLTTNPDTGLVVLFATHQKRREAIWQPAWQRHPNGATDIVEVIVVERHGHHALADYLATMGADEATRHGPALTLLDPAALEDRFGWAAVTAEPHPSYCAGVVIRCRDLDVVREAVDRHGIPATPAADGSVLVHPDWTLGTVLHLVT